MNSRVVDKYLHADLSFAVATAWNSCSTCVEITGQSPSISAWLRPDHSLFFDIESLI